MARLCELSAAEVATKLELSAHPEGGFYRRTHVSPRVLDAAATHPDVWTCVSHRHAWSSILYLLPAGARCGLHSIKSDELWMWHAGAPVCVLELRDEPAGSPARAAADAGCDAGTHTGAHTRCTTLSDRVLDGHALSHVVPAQCVFGAFVPQHVPAGCAAWALVSCIPVPGFDFSDWRMHTCAELLARFPRAEAVIRSLAVDGDGNVAALGDTLLCGPR